MTPQRRELNFGPRHFRRLVLDTCGPNPGFLFGSHLLAKVPHMRKVVLICPQVYHFFLLFTAKFHFYVFLYRLNQTVFIEHVDFRYLDIHSRLPHGLASKNGQILLLKQPSYTH